MYKYIIERLIALTDPRTKVVVNNILQSFILKIIAVILSLVIVPLTINFVNPNHYGIWLTISSIVMWIEYFDLGLGHGLRNNFAKAKANNNIEDARSYLSTIYGVFIFLFSFIFIFYFCIHKDINWQKFLNIYSISNSELQGVILLLVGLFCLNMILKILNSLLLGDQKSAMVSKISVCSQFISLFIILILSRLVSNANLFYLVLIYSGVPCIVYLTLSIYYYSAFKSPYYIVRPSIKFFKTSVIKKLLTLGVKFFVIQLSLLFIFQFVNIILSRNCGSIVVTQYNLCYKYFHVMYMIVTILLTPYWTAFTDAYTHRDYSWMKSTYRNLIKLLLLSVPILMLMLILSPVFFKIWLSDSVNIPFKLSVYMSIYMFTMIFASVSMYVINGIGKVTIQMCIYLLFSIISIPMMNHLSIQVGVYGILIPLSFVYFVQGLIGHIQVNKLINSKAEGIWNN